MFLRKMGRRYLLLHSYRDGRGRVCQRRLGHFESTEEMHRRLGEAAWRGGVQGHFPDLEIDWGRLSEDARRLELEPTPLRAQSPKSRPGPVAVVRQLIRVAAEEKNAEALEEALRLLQSRLRSLEKPEASLDQAERLLEQQDFVRAEAELEAVVWKTRLDLPPRRTRLEEPEAGEHLRALGGLARALAGQGKSDESCRVAQSRTQMHPAARLHLADYGMQLQLGGRLDEAEAQYQRVPFQYAWRHYNLASLAWHRGLKEECVDHILRGLVQGDDVAQAMLRRLRGQEPSPGNWYWEKFEKLWTEDGQRILVALYMDPLVKYELEQIREKRVGSRDLMRNWSRQRLLDRALNNPRDPVSGRSRSQQEVYRAMQANRPTASRKKRRTRVK